MPARRRGEVLRAAAGQAAKKAAPALAAGNSVIRSWESDGRAENHGR
jgi:hypothetical protein